MNKGIAATLCWLVAASAAYARDNDTQVFTRKIDGERSELRVVPQDGGQERNEIAVRPDGRVVVQAKGEGNGDFTIQGFPLAATAPLDVKGVVPFDEAFEPKQRLWGDPCENGPLWFLGDRGDGSYAIAEAIDACGRLPSSFTVFPEKVFPVDTGLALPFGEAIVP